MLRESRLTRARGDSWKEEAKEVEELAGKEAGQVDATPMKSE